MLDIKCMDIVSFIGYRSALQWLYIENNTHLHRNFKFIKKISGEGSIDFLVSKKYRKNFRYTLKYTNISYFNQF